MDKNDEYKKEELNEGDNSPVEKLDKDNDGKEEIPSIH
jgi:hypothetical protein